MHSIVLLNRSSGDTLTRENFYKMKAKMAERRMMTSRSPIDQQSFLDSIKSMTTADNSRQDSSNRDISTLVKMLRVRARDIHSGQVSTLVFRQTKISRKKKVNGSRKPCHV